MAEETFCAFCNQVLEDGRQKCTNCGRNTAPMTDAHRKPGILLLSGLGAARLWDPPPMTYTKEKMDEDLRDDPVYQKHKKKYQEK
jgi:hypothetical protein